MWVLDLDLDFFLSDCCPLAPKGKRPSADCASPWTEAAVTAFLEGGLGLDARRPIPGRITETHDGALAFWQERMDAGTLSKPFSAVHVDAHADLGIGKPGPGFVLNNVLGIPPKERDEFSRYYAQKQLDEANYLLFALAFRWIDALTLVRDPFSRPDLPPFCERGGEGYRPIRLCSFVSKLFEERYGPEPEIPLTVYNDPGAVHIREPFACMNLAISPRYAPQEADALVPVIARYMTLV
ncbi:MAG: UPF0489 family protein [Clostridia bacterium]|nr:UPF0489 family protein [Clostridia bacterium]